MLRDFAPINLGGKQKVIMIYALVVHRENFPIQYVLIKHLNTTDKEKNIQIVFFSVIFRAEEIFFHCLQLISLLDDILLSVQIASRSFFLSVVFLFYLAIGL